MLSSDFCTNRPVTIDEIVCIAAESCDGARDKKLLSFSSSTLFFSFWFLRLKFYGAMKTNYEDKQRNGLSLTQCNVANKIQKKETVLINRIARHLFLL